MTKLQEGQPDVYVVEKILDKRIRGGKAEYKIKWKDYSDPKDETWEPAGSCDCPELVEQFEKDLKEKKKKQRRSSVASNRRSQSVVSSVSTASKGTKRESAGNNEKGTPGKKTKKVAEETDEEEDIGPEMLGILLILLPLSFQKTF
jgi:chromobox protein 3